MLFEYAYDKIQFNNYFFRQCWIMVRLELDVEKPKYAGNSSVQVLLF